MELVGHIPEATRGRVANRKFDQIRTNLRTTPGEWWLISTHESNSKATSQAKSVLGRKADGSPRHPEYECTTRLDHKSRKVHLFARYYPLG